MGYKRGWTLSRTWNWCLALALAAKDTAANLFGSIALLLDKSIRIGEWIKIDEA